MQNSTTDIVTVIGANLIEPILILIQSLEKKPICKPNEVQTNQVENGFSCAIITLSVLLLESANNRTRYIRKENILTEDINQYFANLFTDIELGYDVDEIIALRDVIVHNHLWEESISWGSDYSLKLRKSPELIQGYGDKRHRRVMNPRTRLSRRLKLNMIPIRIWRRDAYLTLRTVYKVLEKLEMIDHNYFQITYPHYMYDDQLQTLSQIIVTLPTLP